MTLEEIIKNPKIDVIKKCEAIVDSEEDLSLLAAEFALENFKKLGLEIKVKIAEKINIYAEVLCKSNINIIMNSCYNWLKEEKYEIKEKALRIFLKTGGTCRLRNDHTSLLNAFILSIPNHTPVKNVLQPLNSFTNQFKLNEFTANAGIENFTFEEPEEKSLNFLCAHLSLEYLHKSTREESVMKSIGENLITAIHNDFYKSGIFLEIPFYSSFMLSAIQFLSRLKNPLVLALMDQIIPVLSTEQKMKLLTTVLNSGIYVGICIKSNLNFFRGEIPRIKLLVLDVFLREKTVDSFFDGLLADFFLENPLNISLVSKIVECHIHLINNSPSLVRLYYCASIALKFLDVIHNFGDENSRQLILTMIESTVANFVYLKIPINHEERSTLIEFFMAPIKLNTERLEFFSIFTHLKSIDQQFIIKAVSDKILIKYCNRISVWKPLLDMELYSMVLCLSANRLLLDDFTGRNFNYISIFPITYQFFNFDKKYFSSMFIHYFPIIIDHMINCSSSCKKEETNFIYSVKEIYKLLNEMFLKITPSSYTGYYIVFNNFNKLVLELYTLYTIYNDTFYLETLFNIPISLGLLVSKCTLIKKPMEAGIRCKETQQKVLAYLDYMIEFDADGEYTEMLEYVHLYFRRTKDVKIIQILNKFSQKHRTFFHTKIYRPVDEFHSQLIESYLGHMLISEEGYTQFFFEPRQKVTDHAALKHAVEQAIFRDKSKSDILILGYLIKIDQLEEYSKLFYRNDSDYSYIIKVISYALIYNEKLMEIIIKFHSNNNSLYFLNLVASELINLLYVTDNKVMPHSSLRLLFDLIPFLSSSSGDKLAVAVKFLLLHCKSQRIFYLCRDLLETAVTSKKTLMVFYDRDCYRTNNRFLKSLYLHFEYKLDLGPSADIVRDLDADFVLNNRLQYYPTLYEHIESLFYYNKNIIKPFFDFYERMKSQAVISYHNNVDFEEFLKPVKRFLPALAVIDGFIDLTSKEEFIESINKNEKVSTENANSIEIFRNLLYNSTFRLCSVFIDIFPQQTFHYKTMIYELLLNLKFHDLPTLDFLIANETFNTKNYIDIKKYLNNEQYLSLFFSKIDYLIVRESMRKNISYIKKLDLQNSVHAILVGVLAGCMENTVKSYYLLEYLMLNNVKYKNTQLIIQIYTDVMYKIPQSVKLFDFYFENLTDEQIEYVITLNPYVTVNSYEKVIKRKNNSKIYNYFIKNTSKCTVSNLKISEMGKKQPFHRNYGEHTLKLSNCYGFIEAGEQLNLIHGEYRSTVMEYNEEESKKKMKICEEYFKCENVKEGDVDSYFDISSLYNYEEKSIQFPTYNRNTIKSTDKIENNKINYNDMIVINKNLLLTNPNKLANQLLYRQALRDFDVSILIRYVDRETATKLVMKFKSTKNMAQFFILYRNLITVYLSDFVCMYCSVLSGIRDAFFITDKFTFIFSKVVCLEENKFINRFICLLLVEMPIDNVEAAVKEFIRREATKSGKKKEEIKQEIAEIYMKYRKSITSLGFKSKFDQILLQCDYYSLDDKPMLYGMIKHKSNIRDIKVLTGKLLINDFTSAYVLLREIISKITKRKSSYTREDCNNLLILNHDILSYLYKYNLRVDDYINLNVEYFRNESILYNAINKQFIQFYTSYFHKGKNVTIDENLWALIADFPKCQFLNSVILNIGIVGEMIESRNIKSEYLQGRFKMWMNRYPKHEFILFNKWRLHIIKANSSEDSKKVNSFVCKLKLLYAKYLISRDFFKQAQIVLNDINKLPSIELNQNLEKNLLDIECCEKMGENSTAMSIIDSINVSRYGNEDKSKLYFLKYKHNKDPFFLNLSKTLNPKNIDMLIGELNEVDTVDDLMYQNKLVEIINESSIRKSRIYVMKLLKKNFSTRNISKEKLYFFNHNGNSVENLLNFNNYNCVLPGEYEKLRDDYLNILEIYTVISYSNSVYEVRLTNGKKRIIDVSEYLKIKKMKEHLREQLVKNMKTNDNKKVVELNQKISTLDNKIIKGFEVVLDSIEQFKRSLSVGVTLPVCNVIIHKYGSCDVISSKAFQEDNNLKFLEYPSFEFHYMFKSRFIENYNRLLFAMIYYNRNVSMDVIYNGGIVVTKIIEKILLNKHEDTDKQGNKEELSFKIPHFVQDIFKMEGLNGPMVRSLFEYNKKMDYTNLQQYNEFFEFVGNKEQFSKSIEATLNKLI
ncbi:hypothetical protein NUSPORA_00877 [Nucleospora cyclopteri]